MLIFDLDGTLVDSLADIAAAVNFARAQFSLPALSRDSVCNNIGDGLKNLIKRSFADAPELDLELALQLQKQYYSEHMLVHTRLFPGVAETLPKLAAKHSLALVTNKPQSASEEICRELKISQYLSIIIGDAPGRKLKPHPEAIIGALAQTGDQPEQSWMIGDHYTDLAAAAAAGCQACFCKYGFGQTRGEKADLQIESFEELLSKLRHTKGEDTKSH